MVNLPFVVEPRRKPILERIGSEESGLIEVERRGYLTTGEKAFVQQVQQYDGGASEIIALSRKASRKYGLSLDKAYNLVVGVLANSGDHDPELAAKLEEDFAEDLSAVMRNLTASQAKEELIMSACMLKYRVDPDFDISEISSIHPDIIAGLAKLYREEDARSLAAFSKDDEDKEPKVSVEEAEKKPARAERSPSKSTTGS